MRHDRIHTRGLAALAAFVMLAAACGSTDEVATTDVPTTEVSTTDDPADPPDVEPGGDGSATDAPEGSDVDTEAPPVEEPIDEQDVVTTDTPNDPGDLGEDVVIADPPFEPAVADRAFCTTLDELNNRPQPETEAEMSAEIAALFAELRPVVPDEILADFDVLDAVVRQAADGQIELDDAESDPAFAAATARIEEFVEVRCDGAEPSDVAVTEPPIEPVDDPPLPGGLTIPVVPINGLVREGTTPYFGARSDDGGGPADPAAGFDVAADDAGFCSAISIINRRPQPRDEFEGIVVAQQYFRAIVPTVPDELSDEFDTIITWVDDVLATGSLDAVDEPTPGDEIFTAVETVDEFVDSRCLGR